MKLTDEQILKLAGHGPGYEDKYVIAFARRIESAVLAEAGEPVAEYNYDPANMHYGVHWLVETPIVHGTKLYLHPSPTPEGVVMVPVEPSVAMIDAAEELDWAADDVRGNLCNQWYAMLAATTSRNEVVK
jgi:hypothetical protein